MRSIAWSAMLVLSVAACADEAEVEQDPELHCSGDTRFLCDEDQLKICGADGRWAYEPCEDICAEFNLLYSGTCAFDDERGHDFCLCEEECCDEGARVCNGDDLDICTECQWATLSCSEYCDQFQLESVGCGPEEGGKNDICHCQGYGEDWCPPRHTKYREGVVNICHPQGVWGSVSCREYCQKYGKYYESCTVDPDRGVEICNCTDVKESRECREAAPSCSDDKIIACVDNELDVINCKTFCDDLGLGYIGCFEDPDRGHDACFCGDI